MRRIVKPSTSQTEIDAHWNRKFNITSFLFEQQLAFIQDPSNYKVAVCSRRAGKTVACAADLIHTAINNKGVICLYITLSAANAKKLVWKELKKIDKDFGLKSTINESELSMTFQNGSVVYCSGAKDKSEIEKFRGLPIKLCYIDECQSFRDYIADLIDDIIEPALLDYNGSLCLIGTPGSVPAGYFYECSELQNSVWSKHKWTYFDNPHIAQKSGKTHHELLARVLKRRGVDISHASIQREYFGKWEFDSESLLILYDKTKNDFEALNPGKKYHYIMGIDVGFNDADALAILAYSDDDPVTYLVEELVTPKQGITELVEQIQVLDAKYKVTKMIMDMGGLGKKIGEELVKRHSIPVEAADKTRKMENIEFLNDALRTGRFRAKPTSRFAQDSFMVEIDWDKSTPDKIKVSDRFHSDIIDAVLYGFKCSPAYAYTPPVQGPVYGSKEWAEKQHNAMFEAELAGLQAEQSIKDEYGDFN